MSTAACCTLFGLAVHSELPLPGFPPGDGDGPRVDVRFASTPAQGVHSSMVGGALQLEFSGVGRFQIAEGRRIDIDPAPGASERNLRVFLLGSAFGALLHQRGLLPLHANAVEIEGRAFAFMGRSGAGKSTLAAWFHDQGYPVLCDDVCAIGFVDGEATVYPGVPRLRLWRDALESSGRSADALDRSFDGQDKFDLPAPSAARERPLGACYPLDETGGEPDGCIAHVAGRPALEALIANTYRGQFVHILGRSQDHLRSCLDIVGRVPVRRAVRRWGREHFHEQAQRLEADALRLVRSYAMTA